MTQIELQNVNKWYGGFRALRDVDLRVARAERIVICGPSGSGKSTLIRCINGLEEHQQGSLIVDGIELSDDVRAIERVRREVGHPAPLSSNRRSRAPARKASRSCRASSPNRWPPGYVFTISDAAGSAARQVSTCAADRN